MVLLLRKQPLLQFLAHIHLWRPTLAFIQLTIYSKKNSAAPATATAAPTTSSA